MLNNLCKYFGWSTEPIKKAKYPENFSFTDHLDLKLQYLKETNTQEDDRLQTLESKTSLLIGQTGIIFSLIGLFIPTYLDKFSEIPILVKYGTVLVFVLSLGFYLNTILQAIRSLNISKFEYARRSAKTVKVKYGSDNEFKLEEVKDLIHCIEQNTTMNNYKGDCLIAAYRSFRLGNIAIGILSVGILMSMAFTHPNKTPKIEISGPVQIEDWHQLIEQLSKESKPWVKQSNYDSLKNKILDQPKRRR